MGAFETNATGTLRVLSSRAEASFVILGPQSYTGTGMDWSVTNAPLGVYTITFSPISNLYSPAYQAKTLQAGQTLVFDGTYLQDTVPPNGAMSVNFEEYATADRFVALTFDLTDEIGGLGTGAQMRFSNDGTNWSPSEPYSSLKNGWDLTTFGGNATPGTKTVYAMVSDAFGNWITFTDIILYVPNRQILEVPGQYATIQAAIDAAQPGDVVYLQPGNYSPSPRDITLRAGVRLQGAEPDKTVFTGFTSIQTAPNTMLDGLNGFINILVQSGPVIISNNVLKAK